MKISINELKENEVRKYRKENNFYRSLQLVCFNPERIGKYSNGFSTVLNVRFYGTQAMTYCCIWGSINKIYFHAGGKAGGYGYDRESAAFSEALTNAGFNVEGLSATGQNEQAINIIASLGGLKDGYYTIISSHA